VAVTNGLATVEWEPFRATLEAKLSEDGRELAGEWKQGPKPSPIKFTRQEKPPTALPADISFTPDRNKPDDVRGQWDGVLDLGDQKLRVAIKIGKLPAGALAGTLVSLDQGGQEMLMTSIGFTNPVVRVEAKSIRGTYIGKLNTAGTGFEGTWEQFGRPIPLNLTRSSTNAVTTAKP
jgi:hypothetical protein